MSTAEKDRVIDDAGFRPNVGIVVTNAEGQVLWGKRVKGKDLSLIHISEPTRPY